MKPGLYQNGRVSDTKPCEYFRFPQEFCEKMRELNKPVAVKDLTFHKMRFLRQPKQPVPEVASKSRRRDQKREEEELQELSAFFSHKKPHGMPVLDRGQRASVDRPSSVLESNNSAFTMQAHDQRCRVEEYPQSLTIPSNHSRLRRMGIENAAGLMSSAHSSVGMITDSKHHSSCQPTDRSPGTESIRKTIAETGIFRNTGIIFDPYASEDGEACESLPTGERGTVATPNLPRKEHMKPSIVRYRDQGTMVAEVINDERGSESVDCVPKEDRAVQAPPLGHQSPSPPNNQIQSRESPAQDTTPNNRSPFQNEPAENVEKEDHTGQNALLAAGPPVRPDAPKSSLISRLEAIVSMPPPPRPPISHPQGVRRGKEFQSGVTDTFRPYHMPTPLVKASPIPFLAPTLTDQAVIVPPTIANQPADLADSVTNQPARVLTTVDADIWPTPRPLRSSPPPLHPQITGSAAPVYLFDDLGEACPSSVPAPFTGPETPHVSDGYSVQASMRDYIAKIEEQVLRHPAPDDPDAVLDENILTGCPESLADRTSGNLHTWTEGHQFTRPSSPRVDYREQHLPHEDCQYDTEQGPGLSIDYVQRMPDWRQSTPIVEETEEGLDMTLFWRPNQF